MPDLELTIVMPCLNEELTLAVCIRKALAFMSREGIAGEVVIGDNGSTDGSQQIARTEGARVVDIPIKGYGAALLGGIQAAQGRYIIMGDSDDSYDFENLMPFVAQLRTGADLVMGNRFKGGIGEGAMPFIHRYLGNPVLSFVGRLFFATPIGDFHCGLRGFSKQAALAMDLRTTGMEFASEMVVKASLLKMDIREVATTLRKDGRDRPPHLRTWRDGWRHLRFLLMYSPRWLFLMPGILLMLVGMVGMAVLLSGPLKVGRVMLDVHTLLYAAAFILIGYQCVTFFIFSKIFTISEGLLPPSASFNRLFNIINLERGLWVGGIMTVSGITLSVLAVSGWSDQDLGKLNPQQTLRQVIPAILLLILGIQTLFSSFFLSTLGLRRTGMPIDLATSPKSESSLVTV